MVAKTTVLDRVVNRRSYEEIYRKSTYAALHDAVLAPQPVGIMIRKVVLVIAGIFMKRLLQPVQVEEESSINVLSVRVREYFLYMHWDMIGVHGRALTRADI